MIKKYIRVVVVLVERLALASTNLFIVAKYVRMTILHACPRFDRQLVTTLHF